MSSLVQVEMLKLAAGPNGVFQPGSRPWLDFKVAQLLVDGGYARHIVGNYPYTEQPNEEEPIETATVEPPEKAVSRRGKRGK
jgi:hypothetical protein